MLKRVLLIFLLLIILFSLKIEAGLIVKSKLVHQFEVKAGRKKLGKIVLKNNSKDEIKVRLYKRDYSFNAKGKNFYRKPGMNLRSNAEWISLQKRSFRISPFTKEKVQYVIDIPDKNLKGTYWCMLMVEEYGSQIKNDNEVILRKFKHKVRYGIQIVTNLGEKTDVQIKYKNPEISKINEKEYAFDIDIINKGIFELIMKPQIIVVNDNTGEIINIYKNKQIRLYPDTSIPIKEKIYLVANISYKIIVIGGNNRRGYHGKEYSIGEVND